MRSDRAHPRSVELAVRDAIAVTERLVAEEARRPGRRIAVDLDGNIVAASEDARNLADSAAPEFPVGPESLLDRRFPAPLLQRIAGEALHKALNASWRGSVVLGPPFVERPERYSIMPVTGPAGLAGWILSDRHDASGSEPMGEAAGPPDTGRARDRIAGLSDDSVLLFDPTEIRFAEADRHVVWLVTDCGRIRAATKGMDNVDRELSGYGFLRIHRSFLINPDRVRRVHFKGNGMIALSTDYRRVECIPVSRRCTHEVRLRLGL